MTSGSLRNRLFLVIIGPLLVVACISSIVRYGQFSGLSRTLYDNALYTVALTISRDVTTNEGDLLTRKVLDELARSLGDTIYYRITGPDGAYVTGLSNAPKVPDVKLPAPSKPVYFDAVYNNLPVRCLFMHEMVQDLPTSGLVSVEVWQTIRQRQDLSFSLIAQSASYFAILITIAALLVWFGIRYGLRPLIDLESAVLARTADDLRPIKRVVPAEIGALVAAMNSLFERLTRAFEIRDTFISDAAHQMRTPIAGIQAQADAALTASNETVLRTRVSELSLAARRAGRLTNQLLSMERVKGHDLKKLAVEFDMKAVVEDVTRRFAERCLPLGVEVNFHLEGTPRPYFGDPVLIEEMLVNLLENAEKYGQTDDPVIDVQLSFGGDQIRLDVRDNGPGIPKSAEERVFDRFYRAVSDNAVGCGLGLAIVRDIAQMHGGDARIIDASSGCCIRVTL